MIAECEDSLLRKFDVNQDYLWLWNSSRGKSGGILVGVLLERFDVGSFKKGDFMIQLNMWDKVLKIKWNLLVLYRAAHEENKNVFLSELSHFCANNDEALLNGDDFNIIRYFEGKKNNMDGVHTSFQLFDSFL